MADLPTPDATPTTAPQATQIPYLTTALPDLNAWTRHFLEVEIPVLAETSRALEDLRANEDDVDAGMISSVIQNDPFMTIKLMAHVAGKRRTSDDTETESITSSLVMMGISPFFRNFGLQPTVEDRLQDQPLALAGLQLLLKRAERARQFAMGFASHRSDLDAEVIQQAAFLHDFAEMLMWCHAPTLELEIHEMQRNNPALRSASMQRFLFNIDLNDLRQALMKVWRLPELLVRMSDVKHANHPTVRNVVLAVRVARHTMQGWDNAALPDDINDIAIFLNASPRVTLAFLHKIDHQSI